MTHIIAFDYKGKKVDIYQDTSSGVSEMFANGVYQVNVDNENVSDEYPFPGSTLDLLQQSIKEWIDSDP